MKLKLKDGVEIGMANLFIHMYGYPNLTVNSFGEFDLSGYTEDEQHAILMILQKHEFIDN